MGTTEAGDVPAGVRTMKAIVQDVYGEADVLRLADIGRPEPGDDEVLLRVAAAGVDRAVWHIMAGLPYPIRLAGYGFRVPKHRVRGREAAGRVEAVGKNVTTLKPGDDAYGIAEGSFAEYAVGSAGKLAPKPTNLTYEQAAATTISALTALQAARDGGHVDSGNAYPGRGRDIRRPGDSGPSGEPSTRRPGPHSGRRAEHPLGLSADPNREDHVGHDAHRRLTAVPARRRSTRPTSGYSVLLAWRSSGCRAHWRSTAPRSHESSARRWSTLTAAKIKGGSRTFGHRGGLLLGRKAA
jgi:Alcohol dehydrogenase GroES-like domain